MSEPEADRPHARTTTFSLFADSYLDTALEDIDERRRELGRRGFIAPARWAIHILFFVPGLAWNLLWWEWANFEWVDVLIGWLLTLILLGLMLASIAAVLSGAHHLEWVGWGLVAAGVSGLAIVAATRRRAR